MEHPAPDIGPLFERFLALPTASLEAALSGAADLVAATLGADKVDAFLLDPERNSLVAQGTSRQPLSALQRSSGLDVLPLANGGTVVGVFVSGAPHFTGALGDDLGELLGVREVLRVESQIAVALEVGGKRAGVLAVASQRRERWTVSDLRLMQVVARWVGVIAHRAELIAELEQRAIEHGRRSAAEELVTVVAHDLRNYLSPIQLRLTAMRTRAERDGRPEDLREVELALKSMSRAERVIGDLLDVARLEHGLFELAPEPIDLRVLADEIATTMSSTTRKVQVAAAERVSALADPARVRQCLENLVANALTHSPDGSAVTLEITSTAAATGKLARIHVLDEGDGIADELLPHIFERYVSGSGKRRAGLGLGLYLAKRIAEAHGGDLTVSSAPGHGTRFTLTLRQAD